MVFPNKDARWNATNSKVSLPVANRLPVANSLLAALPRKAFQHLIDDLEQVALTYGEMLHEPGTAYGRLDSDADPDPWRPPVCPHSHRSRHYLGGCNAEDDSSPA